MSIGLAAKPEVFILDVDGVMTDGTFFYSAEGKVFKMFGADDHDVLSLLAGHLDIRFVTGDRRGFGISRKRIEEDMKMPLDLVSTSRRTEWIAERYPLDRVIYMGDGVFDVLVFEKVGYSIAAANALPQTASAADFVTSRAGGDRAVAEAGFHILSAFFGLKTVEEMVRHTDKASGFWAV
ncbi:hydrolase [Alphaproteobacteria bacterium]|nr:hydrolase [Alphaproteobacteria bacterium]